MEEAERESLIAVERSSGSAESLLCAAEVSAAKLDIERALWFLRRCVDADPQNEKAKEMMRRLRRTEQGMNNID